MAADLNWDKPEIARQTLINVYQQANLNQQSEIPWIIRLFENPCSLIALPGKISLHNHDCLHIIFGMGVSPQEEAFIIGFTMGNDDKTKSWHVRLFKFLSRFIYPSEYQFNVQDLKIFDLGYSYGKKLKHRNLNQMDFTRFYNLRIADLRKMIGIKPNYLGLNTFEQKKEMSNS